MSDFCTQCSIELFGEDFGDMANISTPQQTKEGLYAEVLCEDCGYTQVDHTGKCVSPYCYKKHGAQNKGASDV